MNKKENKQLKDLVIKGIKWSLKKQNEIFYKKENIKIFKQVQKTANY